MATHAEITVRIKYRLKRVDGLCHEQLVEADVEHYRANPHELVAVLGEGPFEITGEIVHS